MEKISLATQLLEAFEKDYSFLLDENWSESPRLQPEQYSGVLNISSAEASKILFQIEAKTSGEQKKLLSTYTEDERKLFMRYMFEKLRGRFKPFPILASISYKKQARATKPAVIFLFILSLVSIIFKWFLWLKIIFIFLFLWFLLSYLVTLNDSKRAKKFEKEQYL